MAEETNRSFTLSPHRAFVVQFYADARIASGWITGRVEHVVSRQATTFESLEVLLTFMNRVLQERDDPPAHPFYDN